MSTKKPSEMATPKETSAPVSIKNLQFIKLFVPVCPMLTALSKNEVPCEL